MVSALVTVEELDLMLRDPGTVVIDVQYNLRGPHGRDLYAAAHVPGSHHVDVDAELSGEPGPEGRHPLPTAHSVEAALRRCGVDDSSSVVVYDQGTTLGAARAWWVFRYFGLADVRVLDGGLAAWQATGRSVTQEWPSPGAGTFSAHAGGLPLLDAEGAARTAREGVLLDARAAERFRGEIEPIDPVAGHIPGAVSAPSSDYVQPDGLLRPPEELRAYFGRLGVFEAASVGTTCGSGITAAQQALALHEVGVEAAVYVGSWSHWIRDPHRVVATG